MWPATSCRRRSGPDFILPEILRLKIAEITQSMITGANRKTITKPWWYRFRRLSWTRRISISIQMNLTKRFRTSSRRVQNWLWLLSFRSISWTTKFKTAPMYVILQRAPCYKIMMTTIIGQTLRRCGLSNWEINIPLALSTRGRPKIRLKSPKMALNYLVQKVTYNQ